MNTNRQRWTSRVAAIAVLALIGLVGVPAMAGNDASIKGDLRSGIQKAMSQFVEEQTVDGKVRIYDPVDGKLLALEFEEVHSGIVKKGDFYVSCADFVDQDGRKVDVDFLVISKSGKLQATQGIVHSVDGKKRKYHLE